ncbi:MAG TPA: hypothetical protein VGJ86_09210 [Acidimicrobiales bacterium]|jgi:hypothetical protein
MSVDEFGAERGDFDFLIGRWRVTHRKLRDRLVGCDDWDEFNADYEAWSHLDGALSLDEFQFPSQGYSACSIRLLEAEAHQWVIYWTTGTSGTLDSPVRGGWSGHRGEFYGTDQFRGQLIDVRYLWQRHPGTAPRWEQAFRVSDGPWETNWTMTFGSSGER